MSKRVFPAFGEEVADRMGERRISENSDHVFLIKPKVRSPDERGSGTIDSPEFNHDVIMTTNKLNWPVTLSA